MRPGNTSKHSVTMHRVREPLHGNLKTTGNKNENRSGVYPPCKFAWGNQQAAVISPSVRNNQCFSPRDNSAFCFAKYRFAEHSFVPAEVTCDEIFCPIYQARLRSRLRISLFQTELSSEFVLGLSYAAHNVNNHTQRKQKD